MPLLPAAFLSPLRKGGKPLQPHRVEPCCSLQKTGRSEVVGTLQARSGWLSAGMGFSRAWNKWADKWRLELTPALECAPSIEGLDKELAIASLMKVLQRSAAGALWKHFPGWRIWQSFASDHGWDGCSFSQSQLVLFLQALAEAGHGAATCAGSLRFVARFWGIRVGSIILQIQW